MIKHISALNLSPASIEIIRNLERQIETLIAKNPKEAFLDGKFNIELGSNSNLEYGLGRTKNRYKVETIARDVLLGIGLSGSEVEKIVPHSDLLVFGEVEEHVDDDGMRYLAVLRAPNGFEFNTEDDDGNLYSDILADRHLYVFNENLPHSVTRHTFVQSTLYGRVHDYCIAINMPCHLPYFDFNID